MRYLLGRPLAALMLVLTLASGATGLDIFPLEPPDTSSPRATLASFLYYSKAFAQSMRGLEKDSPKTQELLARAIQCLDLSAVPPQTIQDTGLESVLRLREILDRIPLPDTGDIPDVNEVKKQSLERWRIPHTEIVMGKAAGKRADNFLFTPETVDQLRTYHAKVRHLPYKEGAEQGIYEEYIYSPGWLIPQHVIDALPDWMKQGFLEQAVWQWLSLVIVIAGSGLLFFVLLRWHYRWKYKENGSTWRWYLLISPLSAMGLCSLLEYLIDIQINITGMVLHPIMMGLEFSFLLLSAWAIFVGGRIVTQGVITSKHIKNDALDADVIKLTCRLISFGLVFVLFCRTGNNFGIPVTAIFTSAGIAGVSVALAARETLANFFGGVSIFLDRPFRAGDYIILDSGERGEVKAIGMRSTRILTRDDILITIPNSVITNVKIVNQSLPYDHFRIRIKIGVAYGSNLEQVEKVLLEVAHNNRRAMKIPSPQVQVHSFGNYAIDVELLVWAIRPPDQDLLTHELSKAIYYRFNQEGIEIPYPQMDIHLPPERNDALKEPMVPTPSA
jgi:MscS family membrane protein